MLREGRFELASFGRVRKVHETAFAIAFGRKSVALKRILDAAFESPSSPGEATFADLMGVLLAIALTPIDRLASPVRNRARPRMIRCPTSFFRASGWLIFGSG